jgi:hypothetical protein
MRIESFLPKEAAVEALLACWAAAACFALAGCADAHTPPPPSPPVSAAQPAELPALEQNLIFRVNRTVPEIPADTSFADHRDEHEEVPEADRKALSREGD